MARCNRDSQWWQSVLPHGFPGRHNIWMYPEGYRVAPYPLLSTAQLLLQHNKHERWPLISSPKHLLGLERHCTVRYGLCISSGWIPLPKLGNCCHTQKLCKIFLYGFNAFIVWYATYYFQWVNYSLSLLIKYMASWRELSHTSQVSISMSQIHWLLFHKSNKPL